MSRANPRFRRTNLPLPVPTGNLYRIFLYGAVENQMTISVFHLQDTQTPGIGVANGMTQAYNWAVLLAQLRDKYTALCSVDWAMTQWKIDSPNNPSIAPLVKQDSTPGLRAAGHEPTTVGLVFLRNTAARGQCGRGRFTTPAVAAAEVTNSKLNGGGATDTAATGMINVLQNTPFTQGGVTFNHGIISRGTRAVRQLGFSTLTSVARVLLLGTIRRRKIGRGK